MTIVEILALTRDAGIIGLLFAVLIGGWKGVWTWGWQLREAQHERDEWKHLALRGTELADRSLSVAEQQQGRRG